jgi:tRNA (uracil-5-)-methyltransferase
MHLLFANKSTNIPRRKMNAYKKGATLIMRDSLPNRSLKLGGDLAPVIPSETDSHICVTAHDEVVREHVGTRIFEYLANDFFQNNNSVLGSLVQYVRDGISRPRPGCGEDQLTHLVDTYCGSGFFAISLADRFVDGQIAGIELSASSIEAAKHNARLNGLPEDKVSFRAGTASQIFAAVQDFPASNTVVVIDPPRKGCDEEFIGQLLKFQPRLLVYVSCNVHTQARDVGMIVERSNKYGAKGYVIESVVGFDLFPQTAHVESVAVLYLPM